MPTYIDGKARGTTDTPDDWARLVSFADACAALDAGGARYAGLGFALGPDGTGNVWQGIDLDDFSARPNLAELAFLLPGYVELSPSGNGFHAIGYGQPFPVLGSNASGVEAYCAGRFFTVTGATMSTTATPVCLAATVAAILSPIHGVGRRADNRIANAPPPPRPEAPSELIADLRGALGALPAEEYGEWIAVGQALYTLGDVGFELWAEWSQKSPKHQPELDLGKWGTFAGQRTGYAAVFSRAQATGWVNPRRHLDPAAVFGSTLQPTGAPSPVTDADDAIAEVSIADLFENPSAPPKFLIAEIVPAGVLTLLGAHGGAGKTTLALQAAVCLAIGRPFFGKGALRSKVIFYSAEDSGASIRYRLTRICRHMDVDPTELSEWLMILDATKNPYLFSEVAFKSVGPSITPSYQTLAQAVEAHYADVVVIDNASDTFDANENERARVREFVRSLPRLRRNLGVSVLLLAHVDKQTAKGAGRSEGYSGSTAWHNSARSRLFLSVNDRGVLLEHQKCNLGRLGQAVQLIWNDEGVLEQIQPVSQLEAKAIVLKLIHQFYGSGRFITASRSGPNSAFSTLRTSGALPVTLDRHSFWTMLDGAIESREVIIETYKTEGRKTQSRLRIAPNVLDTPNT